MGKNGTMGDGEPPIRWIGGFMALLGVCVGLFLVWLNVTGRG